MTIINLTPHPVAIWGSRPFADGPEEVFPPSGRIARIAPEEIAGYLRPKSEYSGHAFEWVKYGYIHDLPAREPDTDYVVSLLVALAVHWRDDLLAPYREVRDAEGTPVGWRSLQKVSCGFLAKIGRGADRGHDDGTTPQPEGIPALTS
jgi:hypothetical protein